MTDCFFAGGEVTTYRRLLHDEGVLYISLNFMSLYPRREKYMDLSQQFPDDARLFVESGAHRFNTKIGHNPNPGLADTQMVISDEQVRECANEYDRFIEANVERIEGYTEFDANPLGTDALAERRQYLGTAGYPVWHAEDGLKALEELAETHNAVAVIESMSGGRDVIPVYRSMLRQGVRIHLMRAGKQIMEHRVPWTSLSSARWIESSKHGDLFVWTGTELKCYPTTHRTQALMRHKQLLVTLGIDPAKVEAKDPTESLRLALWSWQQCFAAYDKGVTVSPPTPSRTNAPTEGPDVAHPGKVETHGPATRQTRPVPGLRLIEPDKPGGSRGFAATPAAPMRCDTCFIGPDCTEHQPGSECAFEFPVPETRDEQRGMLNYVYGQESKTYMVLSTADGMRGTVNPETSKQADRLVKIGNALNDMDSTTFSVQIKAKAQQGAQLGLISRLFGEKQPEIAPARPVTAEDIIVEAEVIDGVTE